jgi:hypothetical protein
MFVLLFKLLIGRMEMTIVMIVSGVCVMIFNFDLVWWLWLWLELLFWTSYLNFAWLN